MELRARALDAQKIEPQVCDAARRCKRGPDIRPSRARTVARISHVPQIGSQSTGKKAVALIFAHASGMVMVNAIARGPGSKGHSRVSLASASGREHRSRIGRDCVRGFCSGGFSAVYALAHAGLRQGGWVRRLVALRGQASASALLIALLLPGCTVGPDYSREPAPVPPTFKELKGWKRADAERRPPIAAIGGRPIEIPGSTRCCAKSRSPIRRSRQRPLPTSSRAP